MENTEKLSYASPIQQTTVTGYYGLTKREHASILILAGLSANYLRENVTGWSPITYVKEAVELTDLLFEELKSKE